MKKFLAGLIAAFMLSAGFVAISAEGANAAPSVAAKKACGGQYQPVCIKTATKAPKSVKVKKNQKPSIKVTVGASSNLKPTGTVVVTVKGTYKVKVKGKTKIKKYSKKLTVKVSGGNANIKLPKLKPGKYTATITYKPAANSNFVAGKTVKTTITVK